MKMTTDLHFIKRHILKQLTFIKWGRFRDLKPSNVDSNLYNYHLKELIKANFVEHIKDKGYRLSPAGLRYADHVSFETFVPRWQPKIITVLVAQNGDNVLMWEKYKQPFISKLSLPSGKIHFEDTSIESAMRRELSYALSRRPDNLSVAGVIEYSAYINQDLITHTIAHVFKGQVDSSMVAHPKMRWVDIDTLGYTEMSPGTKETIEAVRNNQDLFFESHELHW